MKIIQVNGWCGRLNGPLVRFIQKEDPDIICLQEAFDPKSSSPLVFKDQYGYINEILELNDYEYFFAAAWGFYLGTEVIDVGNIIISKFPLSNQQQTHTHGKYVVRDQNTVEKNVRVIQACTVSLPANKKLSVINYQGFVTSNSIGNEATKPTLEAAKVFIDQQLKPKIFCCDLNIGLTSPYLPIIDDGKLQNFTKEHGVKTTLSAMHRAPLPDRDTVACDYIFASPEIAAEKFLVSEDIVSDHKALVLNFSL